jgi:hypothetical protein
MELADFIDARWGDSTQRYLEPDERTRSYARLKDVWRAVQTLTGSDADKPWTVAVHSPKALPALVRTPSEDPTLVWDAGLGTLFSDLAFPVPYDQPAGVVEAILRRIAAVRLLLNGRTEAAAAQVTQAQALLTQFPIDRSYQASVASVDAEAQFGVFLLTELQERFALAHELAHYLRTVDPDAFDAFADQVRATAQRAVGSSDPPTVVTEVFTGQSPRLGRPAADTLYARDLDPYAWYLHERSDPSEQHQDATAAVPPHDWDAEVRRTAQYLESASEHDHEEVVSDQLAALAVALAAHQRQAGWTAAMAATCSRLALTNLETVLGIDRWASRPGVSVERVTRSVSARQSCLDVLLPLMLPQVLATFSSNSSLRLGDLHALMHRVQGIHTNRYGAALTRLENIEPGMASPDLTGKKILMLAGFLPLRPPADHRAVIWWR